MLLLLLILLLIGRQSFESESSLTAGCGNLSCQIQGAKLSIWTTPFGPTAPRRAIHSAGVELCIAIESESRPQARLSWVCIEEESVSYA
jgi:hypothetical protein